MESKARKDRNKKKKYVKRDDGKNKWKKQNATYDGLRKGRYVKKEE